MRNKDLSLVNELQLKTMEPVELVEAEEVHQLTLSEYKREKDILAARRQQVMLQLDGRKLDQAISIIDAMDGIIGRILDEIKGGEAMNIKFLTDSYDRLNKTLQTTCRLDTVDGSGKAARLALQVDFGSGTSVKAVIEE